MTEEESSGSDTRDGAELRLSHEGGAMMEAATSLRGRGPHVLHHLEDVLGVLLVLGHVLAHLKSLGLHGRLVLVHHDLETGARLPHIGEVTLRIIHLARAQHRTLLDN